MYICIYIYLEEKHSKNKGKGTKREISSRFEDTITIIETFLFYFFVLIFSVSTFLDFFSFFLFYFIFFFASPRFFDLPV